VMGARSTSNRVDVDLRALPEFGFLRGTAASRRSRTPRPATRRGSDLAGGVCARGPGVKRGKPGDRVVGMPLGGAGEPRGHGDRG
jgi:NADPH:quinone reductase-like Zn-dependent oxidoreductase